MIVSILPNRPHHLSYPCVSCLFQARPFWSYDFWFTPRARRHPHWFPRESWVRWPAYAYCIFSWIGAPNKVSNSEYFVWLFTFVAECYVSTAITLWVRWLQRIPASRRSSHLESMHFEIHLRRHHARKSSWALVPSPSTGYWCPRSSSRIRTHSIQLMSCLCNFVAVHHWALERSEKDMDPGALFVPFFSWFWIF